MELTGGLPFWCMIICQIGLGLGLLSSVVIMISLIKLPFKDISTELRKYSTISDLVMVATLSYKFFAVTGTELCVYYYLFIFAYNVHVYWIFYMFYAMHRIIYKKNDINKNRLRWVYVLIVILAGGISGFVFINFEKGVCLFNYTWLEFYYVIFASIIPNMIILVIITIFYRNIRKTLRIEIKNCNDATKDNKVFFIRMYGYPVIFFLISITSVFSIVEWIYPDTTQSLQVARLIILCYYPILNSLFYGLTQSSKRFLKYLISRDFEYSNEEKILYELRAENYILPRFYLDLIDKSENNIFK